MLMACWMSLSEDGFHIKLKKSVELYEAVDQFEFKDDGFRLFA